MFKLSYILRECYATGGALCEIKKTAMMGATAFIAAKGQHTSSGSRTVVIIADFIENSLFFG